MTCRDFMRYLIYVEHAAENLQFYLWFLDYSARFKALSDNEKALSPEMAPFGHASIDASGGKDANFSRSNRPSKVVTKFFADAFNVPNAHLLVPDPTKSNPFITPPQTPGSPGSSKMSGFNFEDPSAGAIAPFLDSRADPQMALSNVDHATVAAGAFQAVDLKWQPCEFSIFLLIPIYIQSSCCFSLLFHVCFGHCSIHCRSTN